MSQIRISVIGPNGNIGLLKQLANGGLIGVPNFSLLGDVSVESWLCLFFDVTNLDTEDVSDLLPESWRYDLERMHDPFVMGKLIKYAHEKDLKGFRELILRTMSFLWLTEEEFARSIQKTTENERDARKRLEAIITGKQRMSCKDAELFANAVFWRMGELFREREWQQRMFASVLSDISYIKDEVETQVKAETQDEYDEYLDPEKTLEESLVFLSSNGIYAWHDNPGHFGYGGAFVIIGVAKGGRMIVVDCGCNKYRNSISDLNDYEKDFFLSVATNTGIAIVVHSARELEQKLKAAGVI